jgi:hypothetical protein
MGKDDLAARIEGRRKHLCSEEENIAIEDTRRLWVSWALLGSYS